MRTSQKRLAEELTRLIHGPAGLEAAQRATGVEIACEIIKRLTSIDGLRGFAIRSEGDDDVALEIIEKSGLRCD